jgi:predicted DNA-binding helix-hairpin-helix protein
MSPDEDKLFRSSKLVYSYEALADRVASVVGTMETDTIEFEADVKKLCDIVKSITKCVDKLTEETRSAYRIQDTISIFKAASTELLLEELKARINTDFYSLAEVPVEAGKLEELEKPEPAIIVGESV